MTRLQSAVLVLFIVVLSASLVADIARYAFVATALAIFGFIAIGFLLLPKVDCELPFSVPPVTEGQKLVIHGVETSASEFNEQFRCAFQLEGWKRLGRWLLISSVAFYLLLARVQATESFFAQYPGFSTEVGFLLGMAAIRGAVSWYEEQAFLAHAVITWGMRVDALKYVFVRPETGYHGGSSRKATANPIFVLFDPSKPDENICAQDLKFRSLAIYRKARVPQGRVRSEA